MTRTAIVIALSVALTACTGSPRDGTKQGDESTKAGEATAVAEGFSDDGTAALRRLSSSLQEPSVAAKLRNCFSEMAGERLVATDLRYRKSGNSWTFDSAKVRQASAAQGPDETVQRCLDDAARGTSFPVDSNEELETAAAEFVVRLRWPLPLPAEGAEVSNDAIARMISTGGTGVTMEGCSTCKLKTDGTGGYQCVSQKSGKEADCDIMGPRQCVTTPKACVTGFFGGWRGVIMF